MQDYWREQLKDCIANLTSEYDALLYGGISTTQVDDVFQYPAPAAAFMLPSFSHLFFKSTECMRKDKATCYPETSEWHEASVAITGGAASRASRSQLTHTHTHTHTHSSCLCRKVPHAASSLLPDPLSPHFSFLPLQATHHGLDSMMQRVLAEMTLLTKDDAADLVYNNLR